MLTHRLRKYLSTFKKGFLDDTSYVDINRVDLVAVYIQIVHLRPMSTTLAPKS